MSEEVVTGAIPRGSSIHVTIFNFTGYLRYRGPSSHSIDRRAMISDTSSESSIDNVPYLSSPSLAKPGTMTGKKKAVLRQVKTPVPRTLPPPGAEQRDRYCVYILSGL